MENSSEYWADKDFYFFRKREVNVEPLKTQAENRLDITDTLSSSVLYQKIIILHTTRVRDNT